MTAKGFAHKTFSPGKEKEGAKTADIEVMEYEKERHNAMMSSSDPQQSISETNARSTENQGGAKVRRVNGVLVVTPTLEKLDLSTAGEFKEQLSALIPVEKYLVLDMEGIHFVDSSGLGAILSVLRELSTAGGDLRLCCLQKRVRVMFELVRMHRVLTIQPTVEEAVASLADAPPAAADGSDK